ncbi:hypothetical protein ENUP19_0069G0014 [Entamoeba nuttalli]|uniref:Uncharacterized protein n=1 Tax=Entamoeba nuttalli TaxID=412467 RepID=A0ABQ0DEL3_9EUKA
MLFCVLTEQDCINTTKEINVIAEEYNFCTIFDNYEFYHYYRGNEYNIIACLKHEFVFILSIINKVEFMGIRSLSQEVIDHLLLYIDGWCLRDGILDVWNVAMELHEMEEEYSWESEEDFSEFDLNKP